MGEREKVNAHGERGDKFDARLITYPELGGHVLTPEFDRTLRQRLWAAEREVTQKTKSVCLGSAGARRHDATDRARGKRSLPLEGLKSIVNI